jgi:anti-sigma regulatory factor (Ser/Thr protein kinase)/anti-anti-sigma regulatory factor
VSQKTTPSVQLPPSFNASTAPGFLGHLITQDRKPKHAAIAITFERLSWIDTAGVTILCNTVEWLRRRGVVVAYESCDPAREAIAYLDDCGFFQSQNGKPLRPTAKLRSTTFPVRALTKSEGFAWVNHEMVPWVAAKLQKDPKALVNVSVSVRELLNNIADHSGEDIGCVHLQYYPRQDVIGIAVSDMGIGIPAAMRQAFQIPNDSQAILRATERGVTSKKGTRNQGVGLDVLLNDIVLLHDGTVNILSNRGYLQCFKQGDAICRLAQPERQEYPGTIFEMVLPSAALKVDLDDEDLSW